TNLPSPPRMGAGDSPAEISGFYHSAMRTLITNGTVVNADVSAKADVLIDGETVAAVGRGLAGTDLARAVEQTIDATDKYVIPGAIDVHTHMELPFGGTFAKDTFETGTRAAAF